MGLRRSILVCIAVSATLFASHHEAKAPEAKGKQAGGETVQAVKAGREASRLLIKTLGGNMKKHMKAGGAKDALSFCSMNAAALTAEVDSRLGEKVSVKRITLKPRNPANMAEGDEKEILEALENLKRNSVLLPKYLLQKTESGYKYYKPLLINKKVCLKCHGRNIAPALQAEIKKVYPTDKATGYKMGDLRGAVVVTIKR